MSKEERTHGDEMATIGELHGLYQTIIEIQKRIKILEAIRKKDNEKKENKNAK
jgi:hypothetical protein